MSAETKQPVGLQGDLAAWQKKAEELVEEVVSRFVCRPQRDVIASLAHIRDHLAAMPQAQTDGGLLKALKEIDKIGALLYPDGADVMDDNPFAGQVSEMWRIAAAAIAQHETGAPA